MTQLEYPEDLYYLDTHEYVRMDGEIATIGISAFAIDLLGDIVHLELDDVDEVIKGETFGTIESVKAVEDLKAPINGIVIERNKEIADNLEWLLDDPYGEGWLIKVRVQPPEVDDLLSANDYRQLLEGE